MAVKERQGDFFDQLEIMPAEKREEYQSRGLRRTVSRAYRNSTAARELFDRAGVRPGDIRKVKDLEKLPVTRKSDLIESQKLQPPYGGFHAIPSVDIERVFISPGPIYEPLHTAKIKWFAKAFYAAGFRKGDVVLNTFTYHMSPAGILFHEALRDCGATVVVTGTGNTEIQIQAMRQLKVTGFVGTPSFMMTVIKTARDMGYDFRRDFNLKLAWFTGEMLSSSVRTILEKEYGIATAQTYAVTEPGGAIAYECKEKSGMHLMDEYIVEIIDPHTGKQLGPGEIGEIVVTPIHNRSWGLIRFGTGDMSSYTDGACPCGRTSSSLVAIVGRTGDAVKVRGMFVVARQVEEIMAGFDQIGRFQLRVSRSGERDEMTLRIEPKDEAISCDPLAEEVNRKFQNLCRVKIDRTEFVPKGTIPMERQTIIDERRWK
jgi:phenylacetate-CoA ligase